MPVQAESPTTYLERTSGGFLDGNDDFTIIFQIKPVDWVAASLVTSTLFHKIENVGATKYLSFLADSYESNLQECYMDGSGIAAVDSYTDRTAFTPGLWIIVGYIYDNTAKTLDLYINNQYIDSYSVDFSTSVFANERLGNPSSVGTISFRRYRSWQRKLTGLQLINESLSATATVLTDLFADTPLTNAGDLADVSGNGRDWSPIGSLTTDNDDLEITGGVAPTNLTALTAIEITAFPYANFQSARVAGSPEGVWYKFTAPGNMIVSIAAIGCNDDTFATHYDTACPGIYTGPASSPVLYQNLSESTALDDTPRMFYAEQGETYYISAYRGFSGASDACVLLFQMLEFEQQSSSDNSFFINSATVTKGTPFAAVLDYSEVSVLRKLIIDVSEGEGGNRWANGRFILDNQNTSKWDIYNGDISVRVADVNFTTVGSVTYNFPSAGINRATDTMYISSPGTGATHAFARTVDQDGILGTLVDLGVAEVNAIAPAPGDDYLYFAGNGTKTATIIGVHRINLSTLVINTGWIAGISGYIVTDMLTLTDGTLVVLFMARDNTYRCVVRTYNSAGVQQTTVTFNPSGQTTSRLAHNTVSDETSFWLWDRIEGPPGSQGLDTTGSGKNGRFQRLQVSDLSVLETWYYPLWDDNTYSPKTCITPGSMFGPSSSCPFFLLGSQNPAPPPNIMSGIYKLVPDKRNDTLWVSFDPEETEDVKIPDPSFKSALFGK